MNECGICDRNYMHIHMHMHMHMYMCIFHVHAYVAPRVPML
jgi:hypothetical protein